MKRAYGSIKGYNERQCPYGKSVIYNGEWRTRCYILHGHPPGDRDLQTRCMGRNTKEYGTYRNCPYYKNKREEEKQQEQRRKMALKQEAAAAKRKTASSVGKRTAKSKRSAIGMENESINQTLTEFLKKILKRIGIIALSFLCLFATPKLIDAPYSAIVGLIIIAFLFYQCYLLLKDFIKSE